MKKPLSRSLLQKYQQGLCSPEETALVESWYNQLSKANNAKEIPELDLAAEDRYFRQTLFGDELLAGQRKRAYLKVAASIALFITAGLAIYFFSGPPQPQPAAPFSIGQFQAELLVGNQVVSLDERQPLGSTWMDKHKGNKVALQTKKGQEYRMQLPDGTTVWLNADSRLEIGKDYNQKQRSVYLQGEAYFKVAKNKTVPFIVHVGSTSIEALGTAFNVRQYESDGQLLSTRLDEGSVRVSNAVRQQVLLPGQAVQVNLQQGSFELQQQSGQPEGGQWKDGYFIFEQTPLPEIMADLARWYNFTYTLSPTYEKKVLSGKISKKKPFAEVLRILRLAGINYTIDKDQLLLAP
ncbi:FecR family protein [Sphingobacterium athyrii]|uniref:Anti-sigma factor n=1 Tax=Sphingobacterium athyrii TaxID=2152717 RepID=A0A363NWQ0_9SPHI|nr:FecR family protein [Sphingobacterium athyrii]PUV25187.1 hypothetical protein DCO56_09630 [Sphingobacterium athyrii]